MSVGTRLAGGLWRAANLPGERLFRRALADPRGVQEALLLRTVRANAETAFGREHGFAAIRSAADYRARVPIRDYDGLEPWIDRAAAGEERVLTRERLLALETSSGSTAAAKRIPYTAEMQRQLRRAIAPWVTDLYRRRPELARGAAYWSITPALAAPEGAAEGGLPAGFAEDGDYLGGFWKRLVDRTLAVPGAVRFVRDPEAFRYVTLLFLLRRADLALISVWHPSFLALLLDALPRHWEALVADVARGGLRPPVALPSALHRALAGGLRPLPGRAAQLGRDGPRSPARLWPRLALVSCWGDGHAALPAADLAARLPGVEIQRKGLLATEAFVSLPYAGGMPLAVRSHFFEFLPAGDPNAEARPAHELEEGGVYSVVVTTGGGLYRYRLDDRVRVDGFVLRTPSLRFLGKADHVVDLRGEKLSESFVASAFQSAFSRLGAAPRFALLAPDAGAFSGATAGYTAYVELGGEPPAGLADALAGELSANPHFSYALRLGQLALRVFVVTESAFPRYVTRCAERGQRLGDVKALALSASDWSGVFSGRYLDAPEPAAGGRG